MCTGKRQTNIRNAPSPRTAVTGIDPYNAYRHCIKNSELFQILRERTKKTKAVFLVALRGRRGEIEIPPDSFSFGEAKENAVLHPQMFKRVFALDKSIVNKNALAADIPKQGRFVLQI